MRPNTIIRSPLQLVILLLAMPLIMAGECPEDGPSTPLSCEATLTGPAEGFAEELIYFTLNVGGSWGRNYTAVWNVQGPGTAMIDEISDDSPDRRITFSAEGLYSVTVTLTDESEGAVCTQDILTAVITINAAVPSCEAALSGPTELLVGDTGTYYEFLGPGWNVETTNSQLEVLGAGPEDVSVFDPAQGDHEIEFHEPGTYILKVVFTDEIGSCGDFEARLTVVVRDPNVEEVPVGLFRSPAGKPEMAVRFDPTSFGSKSANPVPVFLSTENGTSAFDLVSRTTMAAYDRLAAEPLTNATLGSALLVPDAGVPSLLEYDLGGAFLVGWDAEYDDWFEFGQLVEFQTSVTDAVPFTGGAAGCLFVSGWGEVRQLAWSGESYTDTDRITFGDIAGAPGSPTSAVGVEADGPLLVAYGGSPGKAYLWSDGGEGFAATELGDLGDTPRLMRWLNGIAVVANFGSDSISIITWDGAGTAALVGSQAVGDGPVGVSLLARSGGGVYALTTGFNDDTYTITEIDASGAVVASTTTALPAGATQPAHGTWLGDANESFVVSCWESGHLYVGRRVME